MTKLYVHTNEIPYGTAFGTLRARFSSLWPPRLLEAILQKLMNYKNFNFEVFLITFEESSRPSEAIRGYQRSIEAARGYYRLLEVRKGQESCRGH